ncbi:MAG: hypothetical protein L7V88_03980, partial [Alphaproteobacteria bacterium]|nr:hypothetical protein [Alphaproteobacteria bacterium]
MQNLTIDKNIDLYLIDRGKPLTTLSGTLDDDGCRFIQERFNFFDVSGVTISANIKKISKDCW